MSEPTDLDLVFVVDCTGSMGSYIKSAQDNILHIVKEIVASEKVDVRFALVQYRDHPPEDRTFVSKVSPFTSSLTAMKGYVNEMAAAGGGDGPEAVADGLAEVLQLPFRKQCAKVVILIADAPPHGLEPSGDGLPQGWDKHDPLVVAHELASRDILVYSVCVEPTISKFCHAVDFMRAVAEITKGQCLALASAEVLASVIIGGALEEIGLQRLMKRIDQEVAHLGDSLSEEQRLEFVTRKLQEEKVEVVRVQVPDFYADRGRENVEVLVQHDSLAAAKPRLKTKAPVAPVHAPASYALRSCSYATPESASFDSFTFTASAASSTASPAAPVTSTAAHAPVAYSTVPITYEQVARVQARNDCSRGYYGS